MSPIAYGQGYLRHPLPAILHRLQSRKAGRPRRGNLPLLTVDGLLPFVVRAFLATVRGQKTPPICRIYGEL